jgi:hypothetical protein
MQPLSIIGSRKGKKGFKNRQKIELSLKSYNIDITPQGGYMKKGLKLLMILVLTTSLSPILQCRVVYMTKGYSAIFPKPVNRYYVKKIVDVSRRSGRVDFSDRTRTRFTNIWLINYVDNRWNFPKERRLLSRKLDTIILRNGRYFQDLVIDFSSRRFVYEFKRHKPVHWSKIKRIYIAQRVKFKK